MRQLIVVLLIASFCPVWFSGCATPAKKAGQQCAACQGTGMVKCTACLASAKVRCASCNGTGFITAGRRCEFCEGTGTKTCLACNGTGKMPCPQCAKPKPQ
ncbi:MAG: hypothetical protein FJ388_05530 [Verrucomicrobia bacterium]|nr:hypothetical protein [Verrucomicrobiota bacterium]